MLYLKELLGKLRNYPVKNIINFQDYINNKGKKLSKVLEKRDSLVYTSVLSRSDISSLSSLADNILNGDMTNILKVCRKKGWSFKISVNDMEYTNRCNYSVTLDLDPKEYKIDEDSIDLFIVTAANLNDCLLDLADGIIEYIGE